MQIGTAYQLVKYAFFGCIVLFIISYFYQNHLPSPTFYRNIPLPAPVQTPTQALPFMTTQQGQSYRIIPKFQYTLTGVIVSYSNADGFTNIWHHQQFKDFINLRDLCVIWGNNVTNGVYKKITFSSDSWTCWVTGDDPTVRTLFSPSDLSNNHIVTDDLMIKKRLLAAHIGDVIQLEGYLVDYENITSGYHRTTSTTREDRGNGACEVVYLDSFNIIKVAHPVAVALYALSKWGMLATFLAWMILLPKAPRSSRRMG